MSRDRERTIPRYWEAVETVWDSINIYDGPGVSSSSSPRSPRRSDTCSPPTGASRRSPTAVSINSSPIRRASSPEALSGFRAIGLDEWASILDESMRFFGEPYPGTRKRERRRSASVRARREQLEVFRPFDDRFFEWLKVHRDGFQQAANAYTDANQL